MGNALFSSSATVHLNSNRSVVAVTYELEHHGIHLDHSVTVLEDYRYHSCFPPADHHYVHLSHDLRRKLRRIERLPVIYNDHRHGYHCVRRSPSGQKTTATDAPEATNAPHTQQTTETNDVERVRTPPFVKTPVPSVLSDESHHTPLPRPSPSPATRPPLQKKNDTHSLHATHSITTGLFLSNETLLPNKASPASPASVSNASIANASVANASMVSETKGSLRSPLIAVFRVTQSSSGHRIDGRDASSDHRHRILLVEGAQRVPVVEGAQRVPVVEGAQRVPVVEREPVVKRVPVVEGAQRLPVKEVHEDHEDHKDYEDHDEEDE